VKTHALDKTRRRRQPSSLNEALHAPDQTCVEIDYNINEKEAVDDRVDHQRWYCCTVWVLCAFARMREFFVGVQCIPVVIHVPWAFTVSPASGMKS